MADSILFLGWGSRVRGRERQALSVFQESIEYWGRLRREREIESVQVALLSPHGGDLNGFAILQGEAAKLDEVRRSADFQRLVTRANLVVDSLRVVPGVTGDALAAQLSRGEAQLDDLMFGRLRRTPRPGSARTRRGLRSLARARSAGR